MEIIELAQQRKAFVPTKDRYKCPHKEAMKLRLLWTYDKPPSKSRDSREAQNLHREASKCAKDDDKLPEVWRMIKRGLKLDPRLHTLYAISGDINMRQEKWTEAIKNFEHARVMAKYDRKLSTSQAGILYNKQLIDNYSRRGHWYYENGLLIEAASDYEQVIVLSVRNKSIVRSDIQDNLLNVLRRLDKYDAFRFYWYQFTLLANEARATILLTLHAEYKIHLREIVAARQILIQALDLDENNSRAQELLEVVHETGYMMAKHTAIWCTYNCYEKALLTVEMARDCDPRNLEYMLLKTIVLRLSGRLTEAASWLQNINEDFQRLVKLPQDIKKSVLGTLTIKQIKEQLIEQWYLIQYDMAMRRMLSGNYEQAFDILQTSVKDHHGEACILLGDSLLLRGQLRSALATYLQCRENFFRDRPSSRTIQLTEKIVRILHYFAREAARLRRSKEIADISEKILRILDEDGIEVSRVAARCERVLSRARSHSRMRSPRTSANARSPESIATGSCRTLLANTLTERVTDRSEPARNLPRSLKILMQYS